MSNRGLRFNQSYDTEFRFPPAWTWGVCADCQKDFEPQLPKQGICWDCRSYTLKNRVAKSSESEIVVKVGFIQDMIGFGKIRKIAKSTGFSPNAIGKWNNAGRIPGGYPVARCLAEAMGVRFEDFIWRAGCEISA